MGVIAREKAYNHDLEAALLGGLLLDSTYLKDILEMIDASMFHNPQNSIIFSAIIALDRKESPIDCILVNNEIYKHEENITFSPSLVYEYANTCPSTKN